MIFVILFPCPASLQPLDELQLLRGWIKFLQIIGGTEKQAHALLKDSSSKSKPDIRERIQHEDYHMGLAQNYGTNDPQK